MNKFSKFKVYTHSIHSNKKKKIRMKKRKKLCFVWKDISYINNLFFYLFQSNLAIVIQFHQHLLSDKFVLENERKKKTVRFRKDWCNWYNFSMLKLNNCESIKQNKLFAFVFVCVFDAHSKLNEAHQKYRKNTHLMWMNVGFSKRRKTNLNCYEINNKIIICIRS